jgi:hypothetical protein
VYWAQDIAHVPVNAPHQTNPRITVWCATYGTAFLWPVFLEEGVNAERYLKSLNDVFESYVNEMPLTVRRRFHLQQNLSTKSIRWGGAKLDG